MREALPVDVGARPGRSPEFEADLVRLHEAVMRMQDSMTSPTSRLAVWLEPRVLGFRWQQVHTLRQMLLYAAFVIGVYLVAPVVATTVTWSWAGAPVWTWLAVAALFGAFTLLSTRLAGESSPAVGGLLQPATALENEADLHELIAAAQRSWRARYYALPALSLTVAILALSAGRDPAAFWAIHPGTLVMLALLVYEFTEAMVGVLVSMRLFAAEARFPHRLSWLDPLASRPVQAMLHTWFAGLGPGSPLIVPYALAVAVLVAPISVDLLFVPLGGVALVGLLFVLVSLLSLRHSLHRIVRHAKEATLETLRERIERLEPAERDLTADESQRLRALLETYAAVRAAPTSPSGAQTLGHALTALAIPALAFFLAVLAEVYAERLLDQLLP
jgi:hypothetical protein